jgi:hypothetical protein
MRHDFDDQIQVRYQYDDEHFDTWVSGTEALQRLESVETEEQIRSLGELDSNDLRFVLESLPETTRSAIRRSLSEKAAERLESLIGGNLIGDAISNAILGRSDEPLPSSFVKERWRALIRYEPFRQKVLELAWIQLEGSFPDSGVEPPPDDWL